MRISLGSRFQFLRVPLMRPDTTTNIRTRTLTQVNTLLTIADSFTPNANKPAEHPQDIYLFEQTDWGIFVKCDSMACLLAWGWWALQTCPDTLLALPGPSYSCVACRRPRYVSQWAHQRSHSMLEQHWMFLREGTL